MSNSFPPSFAELELGSLPRRERRTPAESSASKKKVMKKKKNVSDSCTFSNLQSTKNISSSSASSHKKRENWGDKSTLQSILSTNQPGLHKCIYSFIRSHDQHVVYFTSRIFIQYIFIRDMFGIISVTLSTPSKRRLRASHKSNDSVISLMVDFAEVALDH